jgi:glycine betaine/choline ABC-type transport system substrate-binding protein
MTPNINMIKSLLSGIILFCFFLTLHQCGGIDKEKTLVLGCKNFTEQIILGEIIAQTIEENTDLTVMRKWNLGGTMICHQALISGEIDIYPEYTGTAYINILKNKTIRDATSTYQIVQRDYREQFKCEWLPQLGINNTYTITVRRADAIQRKWKTISDLTRDSLDLSAGFTSEFMVRHDGYPQLKRKYNLDFAKVVDIEPGLMYQAIANNNIDVICGFSTDGRIPAFDLFSLKDDLNFFPPYYAAPVVRLDTLEKHPELKKIFDNLSHSIDNKKMQEMNLLVDEKKINPTIVAQNFLHELNL